MKITINIHGYIRTGKSKNGFNRNVKKLLTTKIILKYTEIIFRMYITRCLSVIILNFYLLSEFQGGTYA